MFTFAGFVCYDVWNTRHNLENEIYGIADIINRHLEPHMVRLEKTQNRSDEEIKKVLDEIKVIRNRSDIIAACLYAKQGNVIAEMNIRASQFRCPVVKRESHLYVGGNLHLFHDITTADGTYVGTLFLISDARFITVHLRFLGIGIALFAVVMFCVAFMIVRLLGHLVLDPIHALINTTKRIMGDRNYELRVDTFYEDELGVLVRAFNDMLQQVQVRDAALMESKESLEYKVEKRISEIEQQKSELVKRNDELERTRQQLVKAMEVKDVFMANMSHEIRTPIHGVQNFVDFLVNDWEMLSEEKKREMARKAQDASLRLSKLINNLLDLAKLENHTMAFSMRKCDICEPLDQVLKEMEGLSIRKGISVTITNALTAGNLVEIDATRIAQVISNLIGNALKFTPVDGQIKIEITESDIQNQGALLPAIAMSIVDQGIGIPQDELDLIFERFAESSRTRSQAGGTGLGLSICRHIIVAHSGKIWAQNNVNGQGATFVFILPRVQPNENKSLIEHAHSMEGEHPDLAEHVHDEYDLETIRKFEKFLDTEVSQKTSLD
ncbi:MAG: HAMP domain-containing protein [Alphaproteobacteria bacterium]|nr:HAMP domain-containing protein [Alphaproteobacteria bacterium]